MSDLEDRERMKDRNAQYPPSTRRLPLSHKGGKRPTSVIEAPIRDIQHGPYHPEGIKLTDVSPRVASFVYFHTGRHDVGRVTEVREPHVLDVKIVECLERDRA